MIYILVFAPLFSWTQSVELNNEEKKYIDENTVVYYGYDPAWHPLEFELNGEHAGISKDYCDIISKQTGLTLKPHPDATDWKRSLELFEKGDIQILPCIASNDERLKTMDFSPPYLSYSFVIVTLKDGDFVGEMTDLTGKTIALPEGYAITKLVEDTYPNIIITYHSDVEACLMEVSSEKAEATIANLAVASHYLNYEGFENLKIAAPTDYPNIETRFAVSKGDTVLLSIVNKGLATITPEERRDIVQHWVSVTYEHGVDMAKIWRIALICIGITLVIFIVIFIWNRKLKKEITLRQAAEAELQESYNEISDQKMIIEMKNDEVLDSIKYAKRLQEAIMPSLETINDHLPNNFVLYKPKDIIAGDFYWMENVPTNDSDNTIFIAAADCTGHGVPGAMVSVVCSNALNRSLLEHHLYDPGQLLDKTTDLVIERFSKSEENVKDGMDISLCSISYRESYVDVNFAGAHNNLWVLSKSKDLGFESKCVPNESENLFLHEVSATRQPVGQFANRKPFETKEMKLSKGDRLYLYSDGFADQFGGQMGKKMKSKAFKKLVLSLSHLDIQAQHDFLDEAFENWKSDYEQLDDVCVIGIEL